METGDARGDLPEPRRSEPARDDARDDIRDDARDDIRVGDADRHAAMDALHDHTAAGRLTLDEFGDRTAAAAAAVTRADVARLFSDLPAPHPALTPAVLPSPTGPASFPDHRAASWAARRPPPLPMVAGLALLTIVPLVVGLAFAGLHVPGLLFLPLFFLVLGGFGRHRRGPHG